MAGCQTNMLNGRDCFDERPPNTTEVEMALKKIDNMQFVGLQEHWVLSMCLYNRIVTGKSFVEEWQLLNFRATNGDKTTVYDTAGYPKDKYDSKVYAAASARFFSDLAKYNIDEESCSYTFSGDRRES